MRTIIPTLMKLLTLVSLLTPHNKDFIGNTLTNNCIQKSASKDLILVGRL